MDPRFLSVLSRQRAAHFAGLAGSDVRVTLRVTTALLNEIISAYTSTASAIRGLRVIPQVGNRFDVHLKLEKPALLPALNLTLVIEKQPELPADTTLGLRLTGGGGIMRFAGSAVKAFGGGLPSGVRIVPVSRYRVCQSKACRRSCGRCLPGAASSAWSR